MKYAKLFSKKQTPQSMAIPGAGQAPNTAGGFAWVVDSWTLLDRFLILGSEGGTYYVGERKLTQDHAKNVLNLIQTDGERVVQRIVKISESGRAPKNDPAIFALALCASFGDDKTRAAALASINAVCRTGTHLFSFAAACEEMRGWGRGLRKAVARWYTEKSPASLAYQAVKYQQRGGWSHRDLLRLAHPKAEGDELQSLFKWITAGTVADRSALPELIDAVERLKSATIKEAARLITQYRIPREAVPSEMLTQAMIWEALMDEMPMTAMIRNLGTMSKVGLLTAGSDAAHKVVEQLGDVERLRKARVHPMALLMAQRTYASGAGYRGSGSWTPVPNVVDALDEAFYQAFSLVKPTGKRYLLGVDVSGSMEAKFAGSALSASEVATAMAMLTVATERNVTPMAFAHKFRPLPLSRRMRLDTALEYTRNQTFGATDCALPMLYAIKQRLPIDVFVVYTDNETWFGDIHPAQALVQYRATLGIDAKLIVVSIAGNPFSIADPRDPGMLDVVGFDTSVPEVMSQFVS